MTNLKELSVSELHQRIKDATDELIAGEIEEVGVLRAEKRFAKVGEKIVITRPAFTMGKYKEGDIFTVDKAIYNTILVEEVDVAIHHSEYEVLVEEEPKSANQQRAELIQRAREFVEDNWDIHLFAVPVFKYKESKRRVTCLMKYEKTNRIYSVGRANCHPDDVFNADIGKAIALARALEIEVPEEFLDAVQPDEHVRGQVVFYHNKLHPSFQESRVIKEANERRLEYNCGRTFTFSNTLLPKPKIINDSGAIYT